MTAVPVEFTASAPEAAPAVADLLSLARSRTADDRQRLLLGIAALCRAAPPTPGAPAHKILGEIFLALAAPAEREIRKVLSESIADVEWAPPALVNMLALDEIEIARPVLARSPLLRDPDLLRVLVEATLEHQIEVARRANISARVADAVIDVGEPAVLTALACNRTAEIGEGGVRRLVEASRRVAALRAPLTRHPKLTPVMAEQLYAWVGQALRSAIQERFAIDTSALDDAIDAAVARSIQYGVEPKNLMPQRLPEVDQEREEMEQRLVTKLDASGQLRPGYLIRAVREGRLGLFETALATLGGFSRSQVRAAMGAETPDPLALACMAVGIDRAVFPALLDEIRRLNGNRPAGGAFSSPVRSSEAAAAEFRRYALFH